MESNSWQHMAVLNRPVEGNSWEHMAVLNMPLALCNFDLFGGLWVLPLRWIVNLGFLANDLPVEACICHGLDSG